MSSRLSIPQPCPASWEQMTPVAGGRYCASCEKVVVDFSRMSEAEVVAWLGRNGRSCGRFRPQQLAAPPAPRGWAAWLAAVVVSLGACESAPPLPGYTTGEPQLTAPAASVDTVVIRGRVLDEGDAPIADVHVGSRADTTYHTRTRPDGSFALRVPAALADSVLILAKHPTGQHFYIPRLAQPAPGLTVRLRELGDALGEIALEPGEIMLPPTAPPPPPPKLSTVRFTAPGEEK